MPWTILHQGVPVATFETGELEILNLASLTEDASHVRGITACVNAQPQPGYAAIEGELRLGWTAMYGSGFLGPVSDPASELRAKAAVRRAEEIRDRLELVDEAGVLVPAWIDILGRDPQTWQRLQINFVFDVAAAGVVARIQPPPRAGGDLA
jgi:hypothetical protein